MRGGGKTPRQISRKIPKIPPIGLNTYTDRNPTIRPAQFTGSIKTPITKSPEIDPINPIEEPEINPIEEPEIDPKYSDAYARMARANEDREKLEEQEMKKRAEIEKSELIYLFFGHQNRFKKSLVTKMNILIEESGGELLDEERRFLNCAVLSLSMVRKTRGSDTIELRFSLEDSGDDASHKEKTEYWVTPERYDAIKGTKLPYIPKPFPMNRTLVTTERLEQLFGIVPKYIPAEEPIVCYFVRHGSAVHNEVKTVNIETNTSLTEKGIKQATEAGKRFAKILNNRPLKAVFVSDLIRTQQTAGYF